MAIAIVPGHVASAQSTSLDEESRERSFHWSLTESTYKGTQRSTFWLEIEDLEPSVHARATLELRKDKQGIARIPLGQVDLNADRNSPRFRVGCLHEGFVEESFIHVSLLENATGKSLNSERIRLKDAKPKTDRKPEKAAALDGDEASATKPQTTASDDNPLAKRIAELEQDMKTLRRTMKDLHMSDKLSGRWIEVEWTRAGKKVDQSEKTLGVGFGGPVEWRLASDIGSQRWLLCAEPKVDEVGNFTLDTTKSPVWIDFHRERNGIKRTIRGIVEYSYGEVQIALPSGVDERSPVDAPRPISFESTSDNGCSVYRLKRDTFKRTGVF